MTAMMRFRRVAQLWDWLPGFRGVAEHESVHKAAQTLGISPSALSRTVKLLESSLGAPLFVRQGSGMELTPFGSELLTITRDIMRQVDDCISRDEARRTGAGPLYVGVTSDLTASVAARALIGPGHTYPTHILRIDGDAASEELLHGNVDLVVLEDPSHGAGLDGERLGDTTFGIYATADHPLAAQSPISRRSLDEAAYVAVSTLRASARAPNTACYCDSIEVARTICESSRLLCVLPDVVAGRSDTLRRLAAVEESITVHALRRTPLPSAHDDGRLVELIARLRAALGA